MSEPRLAGLTALITGGSDGIGRGIAEQFVNAGAKVWLVARDEEKLAAAANEIAGNGGEVRTTAADLIQAEDGRGGGRSAAGLAELERAGQQRRDGAILAVGGSDGRAIAAAGGAQPVGAISVDPAIVAGAGEGSGERDQRFVDVRPSVDTGPAGRGVCHDQGGHQFAHQGVGTGARPARGAGERHRARHDSNFADQEPDRLVFAGAEGGVRQVCAAILRPGPAGRTQRRGPPGGVFGVGRSEVGNGLGVDRGWRVEYELSGRAGSTVYRVCSSL